MNITVDVFNFAFQSDRFAGFYVLRVLGQFEEGGSIDFVAVRLLLAGIQILFVFILFRIAVVVICYGTRVNRKDSVNFRIQMNQTNVKKSSMSKLMSNYFGNRPSPMIRRVLHDLKQNING